MKIQQDIQHEGNLDGNERAMTFDQNAIAHLMSVLTDLYSDSALAVVREYSTNARDSHIEAGVEWRPIEVTAPTRLAPTFTVQDFGVGLSEAEMMDNLTKYGWSSKRDTDEQTGSLGLGSKSGLTYSSQFTMTGVKDGVEAVILVTRDPDGGGMFKTVTSGPTEQPNGVTVTLPVTNAEYFAQKIEWFFQYWEPGTVLVNGERPRWIGDEPGAFWMDEDHSVLAIPRSRSTKGEHAPHRIVMGGVAYPIDGRNDQLHAGTHYAYVGWVPMGSVNFTPNREGLQSNRRTRECIEALSEWIPHAGVNFVASKVAQAATHSEALEMASNMEHFLKRGDEITYKGVPVPVWGLDETHGLGGLGCYVFQRERSNRSRWDHRKVKDAADPCYFIRSPREICLNVTGYNKQNVPNAFKARCRLWLEENCPDEVGSTILLSNQPVAVQWWEVVTVDAETVRDVDLPPEHEYVKTNTERKKTFRRRVLGYDDPLVVEEGDTYLPALWVPADWGRGRWNSTKRNLIEVAKEMGVQVAVVYAKDKTWFSKEMPHVPDLETWVRTTGVPLHARWRRQHVNSPQSARALCPARQLGRYNRRRLCPCVEPQELRWLRHALEAAATQPMDASVRPFMEWALTHDSVGEASDSLRKVIRDVDYFITLDEDPKPSPFAHQRLTAMGRMYPLLREIGVEISPRALIDYLDSTYITEGLLPMARKLHQQGESS